VASKIAFGGDNGAEFVLNMALVGAVPGCSLRCELLSFTGVTVAAAAAWVPLRQLGLRVTVAVPEANIGPAMVLRLVRAGRPAAVATPTVAPGGVTEAAVEAAIAASAARISSASMLRRRGPGACTAAAAIVAVLAAAGTYAPCGAEDARAGGVAAALRISAAGEARSGEYSLLAVGAGAVASVGRSGLMLPPVLVPPITLLTDSAAADV
jgi:hypothetical protein